MDKASGGVRCPLPNSGPNMLDRPRPPERAFSAEIKRPPHHFKETPMEYPRHPKPCFDCKWFCPPNVPIHSYCSHPQNYAPDPIKRLSRIYDLAELRMRNINADTAKCEEQGNWWEPKAPQKNKMFRVLGWWLAPVAAGSILLLGVLLALS